MTPGKGKEKRPMKKFTKDNGEIDIEAFPEDQRDAIRKAVEKTATPPAAVDVKAEVEKATADLRTRTEAAEKMAKDERELRITKEVRDRASAVVLKSIPGKVEDREKLFRKLHDAGLLDDVEGLLKAVAPLVGTGVMKVDGKTVEVTSETAEGKLEALAKARVEKAAGTDKPMSFGEAYAEVMNENPALYAQYRTERGLK